ncbi:MAG: nucleotide pyrophosphohydrolase [Candidatus Latescibacteria bacterium]|jgi:NTP pyrophosphatase (non-canonical NTP hydrolase)|nr:nucleotide pyrophosphohydrolase [Candidatus Latescibacterota bacterium]
MPDDQTTIGDLREAVAKFISARDWERYHTPKNLAMSIAIEAAEVMEHFQWRTVEESKAHMEDGKVQEAVADELADVVIYCLSFCNHANIDLSEAVLKKLARNETRFPAEECRER